jgi:hypothetical protein
VISGILSAVQSALQISQSAVQKWCTVLRSVETGSCFALRVPVVGIRIGIVFRNRLLILRENIHSETFPGMQVSVSSCAMIDADENQVTPVAKLPSALRNSA